MSCFSACGVPTSDVASFCNNCGTKLETRVPLRPTDFQPPAQPQASPYSPAVREQEIEQPQEASSSSKPYYYLNGENRPVGPQTIMELANLERHGQLTSATRMASEGDQD
jgi:hypothetical protein